MLIKIQVDTHGKPIMTIDTSLLPSNSDLKGKNKAVDLKNLQGAQ